MGLTTEQLEQIKLLQSILKERQDLPHGGTLEMAKRGADRFTRDYGIKAMVIRKQNKYEWVSEYYFGTYEYNGKIYYETEVSYEE